MNIGQGWKTAERNVGEMLEQPWKGRNRHVCCFFFGCCLFVVCFVCFVCVVCVVCVDCVVCDVCVVCVVCVGFCLVLGFCCFFSIVEDIRLFAFHLFL